MSRLKRLIRGHIPLGYDPLTNTAKKRDVETCKLTSYAGVREGGGAG